MSKFFRKCFSCFCGYECSNTPKLPRKKKKKLKNFLILFNKYCYHYFMDNPTSCGIIEDYKRMKKLFHLIPLITKYQKQIDYIRSIWEESSIYIDENGRLSWYWESDDDYGGSSGVMPFCYNKEDAGNTWAFSEVEGLIRSIVGDPDEFIYPENIKSDRDLLEFVKSNYTQNNGHI